MRREAPPGPGTGTRSMSRRRREEGGGGGEGGGDQRDPPPGKKLPSTPANFCYFVHTFYKQPKRANI